MTISAADLDVVVFDVFGTLVDWRSSVVEEGQQLSASAGRQLDWPALVDAWRARYQPAMQEVRSGARPWAPLDTLHRETLDALLPSFQGTWAGAQAREHLVQAWHRLRPWPDTVAGLHRLHRHFLLAPLSNGNVRLQVDLARRNGFPWDCILGAEVVRAYKPDPRVYRSVAQLLAVPADRTMLVAAHADDLVAAAGEGMRTAFVHRPDEYGGRRGADEPPDGADLVVGDLLELADLLGG